MIITLFIILTLVIGTVILYIENINLKKELNSTVNSHLMTVADLEDQIERFSDVLRSFTESDVIIEEYNVPPIDRTVKGFDEEG